MSRLLPALALGILTAISAIAYAEESESVPAKDIERMQGSWKVTHFIGGEKILSGETPKIFLTLADERLQFDIKGNQLSFACIRSIPGQTLAIANDLPLPKHAEQVDNSINGDRLIMLTESTGKGHLASYRVSGDSLTIRYPAGCCSRSGNVITYERVK
jgi:hypothetical protein